MVSYIQDTTAFEQTGSTILFSLDAHNHVDDYPGTLGGVRKVHI